MSRTMDTRFLYLLCGLCIYVTVLLMIAYNLNDLIGKQTFYLRSKTVQYISLKKTTKPIRVYNHYLDTREILIKFVQFIRYENFTEIIYPGFLTPLPKFTTHAEKNIFVKDSDNVLALSKPNKAMLTGQIQIIKKGFVDKFIDCGWRSVASSFRWTGQPTDQNYSVLLPLLVPDGGYFQHFIDGVLPKLVQSYHVIQHPGVKLLLPSPRDAAVKIFLKMMGIPPEKVVFDDGSSYYADELILSCVTPPLHPISFMTARGLLGVHHESLMQRNESLVILISRVNARNPGRHIVNHLSVRRLLQSRYGQRLYIFTGRESTEEAVLLFSRAKVVFGVHGGGFYNILFAPVKTVVIEVMPIDDSGHVIPRVIAHTIIWRLASILGHVYWRVFESALTAYGDVRINENKLIHIFNSVDN